MFPHLHSPSDIPGIEFPPPFPSRGQTVTIYNADRTVLKQIWFRPDGTQGDLRLYAYNGPGPLNKTIATITRTLYDIDGATVTDTLIYTYAYAGTPLLLASETVT